MDAADFVGMIGVVMVLAVYLLLQLERLSSNSMTFLLANSIGAVLIIISLLYHWNLSSFVIEVLWLLISLVGMVRVRYKKKNNDVYH